MRFSFDREGCAAPPSGLPAISPSRGEIGRHFGFRQFSGRTVPSTKRPISPLEGEMSGRTEGGA
ncbi:MAG: propionyl-coenzyme A carboxylase alpha polypeptide [Mesorhizobium sp.]|nr:MAG: propionyl-coenzyme A carboxylase alpha polypeptide [Mesorhizobium sp.]